MGIALVAGRESHKQPSRISSLNDMPLSFSITFFKSLHLCVIVGHMYTQAVAGRYKVKYKKWVLGIGILGSLGIGYWGLLGVGH